MDIKMKNKLTAYFLSIVILAACLLGGLTEKASAATDQDADGKFSIAIIPDTQQETVIQNMISKKIFKNRTQWLADNKNELDLRYVVHTGDVVNWDTADHAQFAIASEAMKVLDDANIDNSLALGNHDTAAVGPGGSAIDPPNTKTLVRKTITFNTYFPVSRYPGMVTYEADKVDNAYRTFNASGVKWLVLTLELWPRTEVVSWADQVVSSHMDYNVIVATHSYMNGDSSIYQKSDYGSNSPKYLFDNLIKLYPNIKMVFSGHVGISSSRVDTGVNGNKIVSILGCFHDNNENPVQIVEIDVNKGTLYSYFFASSNNKSWPQYAKVFDGMSFIGAAVVPSPSSPVTSPTAVVPPVETSFVATNLGTTPTKTAVNQPTSALMSSGSIARTSSSTIASSSHVSPNSSIISHYNAAAPKPKSFASILFIVAACVAIVACSCAAFILYRSRKKGN